MSDKEKEFVDEAAPSNFEETMETEEKVEAEKKEVVVKEDNGGEIEEPKADTYVDDLEYDVDDDADVFVDDELEEGEDEEDDPEEPTEEFVEELKRRIFSEITQKNEYTEEAPKKKPRKAPSKDNRGVTLGGRVRSKNAPNKYKQLSNGQLMRRGVYKINDDEPVKHVGKGTISSDIPKRKNCKKG